MPTTIKTRRSKPAPKGQPSRRFPRPSGGARPPQKRPQFPRTRTKPAAKGTPGLIGRARTTLLGRKPPAKRSALNGVVSSLSSTKLARKPSKGIVGIVAGGLGIAAMAKRRRSGNQEDMPTTPPLQPVEASGEDGNPTA